jgi:hypothetical protein
MLIIIHVEMLPLETKQSGGKLLPHFNARDFNAKVGRENIFKPTIGNEILHQDINDNGVRIINFATSKNLVVKSTMFPHRNIHKYTWTFPDGQTHN